MRRALATVVLLGALPALADDAAVAVPGMGDAYQRIEAQRAREMADFQQREAVCYQRFAVNDCLRRLQPAHRAVLDDLRRQEARLHDSERAQQGAEQLQRAAQKAEERRQSEAQAADVAARAAERRQAQQEKQAEHAAQGASEAAAPSAAAPSRPDASARDANAARYAAKQAEAQKKREEVARRLKDRQKGKPVPPLPAPP